MNKQTLKTHIFFSLLLISNISIYAKSRSSAEALSIANSFYQSTITAKSVSTKSSTNNVGLTLAYSCTDGIATRSSNENAYYYIFNRGDNNGFIVISGDDRAKSVLGYSDSGSFSLNVMPENFKNWMSSYQKELKALAAISDDATSTVQSSSVLSATIKTTSFSTSISPLLGTIAWDQLSPYNILCPKIGSSRAPTGCVATAMAQIMKYYQWPVKGAGSKKYKPASMTDSLYVDFSKTTYNWSNMKNTYSVNSTAIQDTAVATLMYHCGVSVDMDYTAYSSAAYSNYIPATLSQYFGYDSNIQIFSRDFYTEAEWLQMIKTELNAGRPILYGGSSTSEGGHQFICDGYDTNNLFHFNWGWGGYYNGYFELSSLNYETPGIDGSVTGGFTVWQDMVTGIQKPTTTSSKSYEIYLVKKIKVGSESITRSQAFSLNFGYANYGGNLFSGNIAFGLYQGSTLVSVIKQYSVTTDTFEGNDNLTVSRLEVPTTVANGTYKLYCIYKASDQSNWSILRGRVGTPNSLDVTVTSANVTFATPDVYPKLALTGALSTIGNLYYGKAGTFSATIQNTGGEFNSYLSFYLTSTEANSTSKQINNDPINIPSGATKTIEISDDITLTPGTYVLTLNYDANNNQDSPSMVLLTPNENNSRNVIISSGATGIEEASIGKLCVYPNPATDLIYVQSPSIVKSILIFDISGKSALLKEPMTAGNIPISVSDLSKGVYLIKIETEDGSYTEKFFKK